MIKVLLYNTKTNSLIGQVQVKSVPRKGDHFFLSSDDGYIVTAVAHYHSRMIGNQSNKDEESEITPAIFLEKIEIQENFPEEKTSLWTKIKKWLK